MCKGEYMKIAKGLMLLAVLGFFSCTDTNSPEAVTVKFVKALNALDFKAAGDLATEEGKKNLQMMESFMTMAQSQNVEPTLAEGATPEEKTTYDEALKTFQDNKVEMDNQKTEAAKADVKVLNTTIDGETAKVQYQVIPIAKEGEAAAAPVESQTVDLQKVDGVWKVNLKKEA